MRTQFKESYKNTIQKLQCYIVVGAELIPVDSVAKSMSGETFSDAAVSTYIQYCKNRFPNNVLHIERVEVTTSSIQFKQSL